MFPIFLLSTFSFVLQVPLDNGGQWRHFYLSKKINSIFIFLRSSINLPVRRDEIQNKIVDCPRAQKKTAEKWLQIRLTPRWTFSASSRGHFTGPRRCIRHLFVGQDKWTLPCQQIALFSHSLSGLAQTKVICRCLRSRNRNLLKVRFRLG